MSYAEQEYYDIDMPQDLSPKYKSVSVQTDKCGKNNLKELFDGFSQKQIGKVMDILVQYVKNDSENIASSESFVPEYCEVRSQIHNQNNGLGHLVSYQLRVKSLLNLDY